MTQRILGPIRVLQRAGPQKPYSQSQSFSQGGKSRITYRPWTDTIYVTHLTSDISSDINVGMNSIIINYAKLGACLPSYSLIIIIIIIIIIVQQYYCIIQLKGTFG